MITKCEHCGMLGHAGICPTIKSIEYDACGRVRRVEYKTAADYAVPQPAAHPYPLAWSGTTPRWPLYPSDWRGSQ